MTRFRPDVRERTGVGAGGEDRGGAEVAPVPPAGVIGDLDRIREGCVGGRQRLTGAAGDRSRVDLWGAMGMREEVPVVRICRIVLWWVGSHDVGDSSTVNV